MSALAVLIDGKRLPDDEARSFWKRFSAWMEEHRGDLAGFAHSEGLTSVGPEMHDSGPVLVASRTAPQRPYTVAPKLPATGLGSAAKTGGARKGKKKIVRTAEGRRAQRKI